MPDPRVTRRATRQCPLEFPDDDDAIRRCIEVFATATRSDEARRALACVGATDVPAERSKCSSLMNGLVFPDGATPILESRFGTSSEQTAQETVRRFGLLLHAIDDPSILEAAPAIVAPTAVEVVAPRHGRRPRVPLGERIRGCAPSLPPALRGLETALDPVVRDLESHFPNSTVAQLSELCRELSDAMVVEPALREFSKCLCEKRPPSVLEAVLSLRQREPLLPE